MAVFRTDQDDYWTHGPSWLAWIHEHSPETGIDFSMFPMAADGEDREAPLAAMLRLPPGGVLPRHAHDCYRVEVVLHGELRSGDILLRVGDVHTSAPGEFYGPNVAGSQGCISVEIFSRAAAVDAVYADGADISDVRRDAT